MGEGETVAGREGASAICSSASEAGVTSSASEGGSHRRCHRGGDLVGADDLMGLITDAVRDTFPPIIELGGCLVSFGERAATAFAVDAFAHSAMPSSPLLLMSSSSRSKAGERRPPSCRCRLLLKCCCWASRGG